jgi:SET domain-containing protein
MFLGGIGRYINDPRSARQTNVKYQKKDVDKVIIVATRNILSREELLGSYGNQFNF